MLKEVFRSKEKKVEYIELIYDLIFVYIVGRNNSLLHNFSDGFVTPSAFFAYALTTLTVIQIWNHSTYYINIYGRHSVREHVFLFINMFLLYYIGEGPRTDMNFFYTQYHIAWALILVNIGIQYLIELRRHENGESRKRITRMALTLFAQAGIVLLGIPVYKLTSAPWLSLGALLFGIGSVLILRRTSSMGYVDFGHLSERSMLYVVLTFGEMIIAVSSYFEDGFTLKGTYMALTVFLIVVGLFLSYGMFFDHIIDRELRTNGLGYMIIHIFIIFAMNNITSSLEFMHEEEIETVPKMLFLISSFLMYFVFLFALGHRYAKPIYKEYTFFCFRAAIVGMFFAALMLMLRNEPLINLSVTAISVFTVFAVIFFYSRRNERENGITPSPEE